MATKEDIKRFLEKFLLKSKTFGISYFGGCEKNMNTLAELE